MKNRSRYAALLSISLAALIASAGVAKAQDASGWVPVRVAPRAGDAAAKETKALNIGRSEVRLKHVLPPRPSGDQCGEVKTISSEEAKAITPGPAKAGTEGGGKAGPPAAASRAKKQSATPAAGTTKAAQGEVTAQSIILYPCCDCNRILLDGIFLYSNAPLSVFNSDPHTVVTVTLTHDGPGTILFAPALDGPYAESIDFDVSIDGDGRGSRPITFFVKGAWLGQANMRTLLSSGSTNPVPRMEVFACNCPAN